MSQEFGKSYIIRKDSFGLVWFVLVFGVFVLFCLSFFNDFKILKKPFLCSVPNLCFNLLGSCPWTIYLMLLNRKISTQQQRPLKITVPFSLFFHAVLLDTGAKHLLRRMGQIPTYPGSSGLGAPHPFLPGVAPLPSCLFCTSYHQHVCSSCSRWPTTGATLSFHAGCRKPPKLSRKSFKSRALNTQHSWILWLTNTCGVINLGNIPSSKSSLIHHFRRLWIELSHRQGRWQQEALYHCPTALPYIQLLLLPLVWFSARLTALLGLSTLELPQRNSVWFPTPRFLIKLNFLWQNP